MKLKTIDAKLVDVSEWDALVEETYGRPYCYQQQDGCQSRGVFYLTVPSPEAEELDAEMNDEIPEIVNGEEMGVKFAKWLERDPKQPIPNDDCGHLQWNINLFWQRNFYPDIHTVANDLHAKGLLEAGEYAIAIDW